MVDVNILLRNLLLTQALGTNPVTIALGSNNVFAGDLPEKTDANSAPAIVLSAQGGDSHAEILDWVKHRVQLRVWAGVGQYEIARKIFRAVHDWIHGAQQISFSTDGFIVSCLEVVAGQDITDPDTGWATVVAFYEVTIRT